MLVSEFLSKNKNISKKNVTFVTISGNPSICKEKSVTKPKNEFCYYSPETLINKRLQAENRKNVTIVTVDKKNVTAETLINKGLEPHSNESNESNATKTQNQFLNFNAVDWLDWYNERAAIYEYENGDIRSTAEMKAFDNCIAKFREFGKAADLETAVKIKKLSVNHHHADVIFLLIPTICFLSGLFVYFVLLSNKQRL